MTTLVRKSGEQILSAELGDDALTAQLADGRAITVPLAWYPQLLHASNDERSSWRAEGSEFTGQMSMKT